MEKVLTVSIAAYNVEKYIRKTLESCIVPELMDDLEILIVDDGATDSTANIVKEYELRYPQTFRFIHKDNGGYGTTVNLSMKEATGRYFRLLDGDDWFDTEGLKKLIEHLKKTDVDALFTEMFLCYPESKRLEKDTWESLVGRRIRLSDVPANVFAGMWEFTVKTSVLREHPFELPSKTLYTDHLFLAYPIPHIREVEFLDFPLYCYRLGYDEQSVSKVSRIKHLDEILKVSTEVSNIYKNTAKYSGNRNYALERARFCHMEAYRALLLQACSIDSMNKIKNFDKRKDLDEDIVEATNFGIGSKSLRFIRRTNYYGYYIVKLKYQLRSFMRKKR